MQGKKQKKGYKLCIAVLHKWILKLKTVYSHRSYDKIEEKDLDKSVRKCKGLIGKEFSKLHFITHFNNNPHHQKLKSKIRLNH